MPSAGWRFTLAAMLQAPIRTACLAHAPPLRLHQPPSGEFLQRFAPDVSPSWRIVGIFWVDGADHEPGGFEVILMPPMIAMLVEQGSDPEVVRHAVATFLATARVQPAEFQATLTKCYAQVPKEKHQAVAQMLQKMHEARESLTRAAQEQAADQASRQTGGQHVEVVYLHESMVLATHRRLTSEQGAHQLVTRRLFEESTAVDVDDDEEETAEEKPAETKPAEGQ